MIRYRLECVAGHGFEAWFASSNAYDRQEADGLLECPHCASREVRKALMAPNVATRKGKAPRRVVESVPTPGSASESASAPPADQAASAHGPAVEALRETQAVLRAIRDKVRAEAEYVGSRFAEEARRIHFDETPNRGIYGEATHEEVTSLAEDGIDVMPLPRLPDDLT